MIKATDEIKNFPDQFNRLEGEVKSLAENTRGIKIATWVTAISSAILAVVGIVTLLK